MLLEKLIERYELATDLKRGSVDQLKWTAVSFGKHLGRQPGVADLTADAINGYLKWLRDSGRSPSTVRGRRINLVTLWRFARRCKLLIDRPSGVRKVKVPRKAPQAWTQEEVQRLLAAATTMRGTVPAGHKACVYWSAYIRVAWDSGLRRCDIVNIKVANVSAEGYVSLTQEKTGNPIICRLHPTTVAVLGLLDEYGLAWTQRPETFYKHFRALLARAGLTGKPKWIRRSSATAVELQAPGTAGRHLGHSTPGIAEKFYLDPRILAKSQQPPPPLEM